MMASSVMLRAASMPAAARSASCRFVHEGDVRPVGIVADHLPHRRLQVPPALVVGLTADGVLHGQFCPRTAVVPVVHHLEGQPGQRFEVLGRIVDGGAGRDDPQGLELRHQLPALLLQPVQQVEAVGAQGSVVGVGLVQDEKRQVGQEAAHVVLGVLHLPEVVAQRPPAVEGLRVGHQPLLDHVGGHQRQPGALEDLPPLGEVAHVSVNAVDAGGVQPCGLRHALPADDLVPGQGLDGVDGDGRGVGVGGQMIQGGRLEHQGFAAGGAGADHQVVALAQQLQPHGLVQVELAVVGLRLHCGPDRAGGQPGRGIAVAGLLAGDGDLVANIHGGQSGSDSRRFVDAVAAPRTASLEFTDPGVKGVAGRDPFAAPGADPP